MQSDALTYPTIFYENNHTIARIVRGAGEEKGEGEGEDRKNNL